jgi:hypothetical protein
MKSTKSRISSLCDAATFVALFFVGCLLPVRGILPENQLAPVGFGAYGYLVFTHKPSDQEKSRYLKVCDAYIREFQPQEQLPNLPHASMMVTFWPVNRKFPLNKASQPAWQPACSDLVESYGQNLATELANSAHKPASVGPVLVAWTTNRGYLDSSTQPLVLDLSDFADDDIDRAFQIWKGEVSKDPVFWYGGFKIDRFREAFRNLISRYGAQILTIVSPSGGDSMKK